MSRDVMQQAQDALFVAREFTELYDTEHAAWVNEKCHEAIAALRAALAEQHVQVATADASLGAAIEAIDAALAEQAQLANTCNGMPMYEGPLSASQRQDTTPPEPVVPFGWRMVPVEPTEAMEQAMVESVGACNKACRVWTDILAAAPEAPAPVVRQPLTNEDIHLITGHCGVSKHAAISIARAVEAAVLERMGAR